MTGSGDPPIPEASVPASRDPRHLLRLAAIYEFLAWAILVGLGLASLALGGLWIRNALNDPHYLVDHLLFAAIILIGGLGMSAGLFSLFKTAAGVTRELAKR